MFKYYNALADNKCKSILTLRDSYLVEYDLKCYCWACPNFSKACSNRNIYLNSSIPNFVSCDSDTCSDPFHHFNTSEI